MAWVFDYKKRYQPWEWENVVVQLADSMIEYDYRLLDLVSNFGLCLSTIYRALTEDLKYIDDEKFVQCKHIMQKHKHNRLPRGRRY
jgi:hypothetical protein